jgi:hypothetical protein
MVFDKKKSPPGGNGLGVLRDEDFFVSRRCGFATTRKGDLSAWMYWLCHDDFTNNLLLKH